MEQKPQGRSAAEQQIRGRIRKLGEDSLVAELNEITSVLPQSHGQRTLLHP